MYLLNLFRSNVEVEGVNRGLVLIDGFQSVCGEVAVYVMISVRLYDTLEFGLHHL